MKYEVTEKEKDIYDNRNNNGCDYSDRRGGYCICQPPQFGRLPQGERLERIRKSPHYRDGQFHNLHPTVQMTAKKGRLGALWSFVFKKEEGLRPQEDVPAVKTDLKSIGRDENVLVWFGHSSYFIQADGKRILVDPVFCAAAPLSFLNKPFKGTDIYKPERYARH